MAEGIKKKLRDVTPDGMIWQNLEVKGVIVDFEQRKIAIVSEVTQETSLEDVILGKTGHPIGFIARDNPRKAEFQPVYEYLMQNAELNSEDASWNMAARNVEVVDGLPAGTCVEDFPPIHPVDLPEIERASMPMSTKRPLFIADPEADDGKEE